MHTIFWLENLKERDHSEDLGVDGRIKLEWILGYRMGGYVLNLSEGIVLFEFIWLRTGTSG
jgi:hypothetical protein